jgi:hypothetical protein
VLGLADEDVEPDGDGEGVGEVVFLFCAFFAGGALGVPDVPLVEADLLATDGGRDVVLNAGEVDETRCDLNGTLSRPRCCTLLVSIPAKNEIDIHTGSVLVVIRASSVNMNTVLINKTSSGASTQSMNIKLDALLNDI